MYTPAKQNSSYEQLAGNIPQAYPGTNLVGGGIPASSLAYETQGSGAILGGKFSEPDYSLPSWAASAEREQQIKSQGETQKDSQVPIPKQTTMLERMDERIQDTKKELANLFEARTRLIQHGVGHLPEGYFSHYSF